MSRYATAHAWANLAGVGDARPTAQQIIRDCNKEDGLAGKVILVTGVSSGIGAASAIALASTGATVFAAGRSIPRAKAALAAVADSPRVHFLELDLSSQASVKAFAAEFLKQSGGRINILLNNAGGIMADYKKTVDGVESQFAINYLSPFLLFALLKDALLSSATDEFPSRVINVTSSGHRNSGIHFDNLTLEGEYSSAAAYGQAKTGGIYMASEIERRYGSQGLHAWSVHPGAILESAFLTNSGWNQASIEQMTGGWPTKVFKSIEQGAATQVWAAISDDVLADGVTGRYLEDVSVSKPKDETDCPGLKGYVEHTYDQGNATRLWEVSEGLVGLKA
ncbi:uncharacterized protein NECHADRAFT_55803 [Fusarium vanettenii 77-13-4]|jgi:NAD(P)-dependent dehydrogenase (short-subunit alcohol dehydrogenase family)|uniref:Uncharacterized protein n=1 Tax=Fusarium vanettenii (strain ATCC MYA-4622 / CBS 123669 / FGSC 9596 / NRRL 45880 / 77-13-4) TaxID=660122 RepID=C7ZPS3_FUSV7|nr:uncharacterized protein NECHADRAFT_55803 [Fusarium vanettenii 77-13-4]EEU33994.1 hypothetical protein NECHADRAFT_55803 [Fusarium vanettenii 77-13-4]